jgi:hypothetical protein
MMDTRPGVNPLIGPHLTYFIPMPAFDPGAPRVSPIAATYPLGAQATFSATKWDARGAVLRNAPTRSYVINAASNPPATPVVAGGFGFTPRVGLRVGTSFAHGAYVAGKELPGRPSDGRTMTLVALEGEYAFAYTRIAGEVTRNSLETAFGHEEAYQWFVQGVQTLTPRLFVAARQEGVSAPPLRTSPTPVRRFFHMSETTLGLRVTPEITLRAGYYTRKSYTEQTSDHQVGASVVWARRWW